MRWLLMHLAAFVLATIATALYAWVERQWKKSQFRSTRSGDGEMLVRPVSEQARRLRNGRVSAVVHRTFVAARREFHVS